MGNDDRQRRGEAGHDLLMKSSQSNAVTKNTLASCNDSPEQTVRSPQGRPSAKNSRRHARRRWRKRKSPQKGTWQAPNEGSDRPCRSPIAQTMQSGCECSDRRFAAAASFEVVCRDRAQMMANPMPQSMADAVATDSGHRRAGLGGRSWKTPSRNENDMVGGGALRSSSRFLQRG